MKKKLKKRCPLCKEHMALFEDKYFCGACEITEEVTNEKDKVHKFSNY